jgi:hypothetical protein
MMSVRATERLVGDVVVVTGLPSSPKMLVQSVDIDAKQVNTIWFCDCHGAETGTFPATALDRAEADAPAARKPARGTARKSAKNKKR